MLRIGVKLPGRFGSAGEFLADAQAYEAAGAHSLWLGDELFRPAGREGDTDGDPGLECLALLAALAGVTSRVRLGTAGLVAPRWPPLLLAQVVTTVENLSRGRAVVGLGAGREPAELAGGPAFEDREACLEELLEVVRRAWSGRAPEPYEGRRYRLPALRVASGMRPGGPPVLLVADSDAAVERAVRLADGLIAIGAQPERVRALRALAEESRRGLAREGEFELWVEVPAPPGRSAWRELLARYGEAGATGLIVAHAANLLDILRNPEEDDRQDLGMAVG